jgi:hypothetical protein
MGVNVNVAREMSREMACENIRTYTKKKKKKKHRTWIFIGFAVSFWWCYINKPCWFPSGLFIHDRHLLSALMGLAALFASLSSPQQPFPP